MKFLKNYFALFIMGCILPFSTSCSKKDEFRNYTIGIVTWIGYGPLFIAKEKGFFKEEGLNIGIKILDGSGQREAAFLSGELDFFPNTPDAFAIFAAKNIKGKMVMPMDESYGADGLVAKKEIQDIKGLKGKKVGFQSGITSHFFLLYLLEQVGISGKDIIQENLGAGEAGAAFVAGKLDAAVTWEPWLSKAKELPEGHVLATSKDTPGLLADVLMVSDNMLEKNRKDVLAFMRAWFKTIEYFNANKSECITIMAKSFKLSETDVKDMLATDRFFTLAESKAYFGNISTQGEIYQVFDKAKNLYKEHGIIKGDPSINELIDISLLNELSK